MPDLTQNPARYLLSLDEISLADLPLVGGKGANLGELVRAGLPVPRGFCIAATAYTSCLKAAGLIEQIEARLETIDYSEPASVESAAERIRASILGNGMPPTTRDSVEEAYMKLSRLRPNLRVGVRSSATAEDLPGYSFAGQQDTYLGIADLPALQEAVLKCWASLWTARAITYRQKQGFRHLDVAIAVVVQEMFPSEISGVMFTVDPVRGDTRRVAVSASYGLGEAIVSGLVSPDYWIIDKRSGSVVQRDLGTKTERVDQDPNSNGVRHSAVTVDLRERFCLTSEQLAELVRIGCGVERHYGYPQDIEWGYADGRFAVLQARPVTGVPIDFGEELDRWNRTEGTDDSIVWSRAWADAFQTSPTTPLMYTVQQSFIARSYDDMYELYGLRSFLRRRMYRWYRTRPYYSASFEEARLRMFPKFARTSEALAFIPPEDHDRVRNLPFDWWRVAYAQVHALLKAPRYSFWRCADTFYQEFGDQVRRYQRAMSIDFTRASYEELKACFRECEDCFVDHARSTTPGIMDYCYFLILALSELLRRWAGDTDQSLFGALLSGLSTRTVQENIEVWNLAQQIRRSPELSRIFENPDSSAVIAALQCSPEGAQYLSEIRTFVAANGHRGASERDLSYPRWRHRIELLINALRSVAAGDASADPSETEERMKVRRLQVTRNIDSLLGRSRYGWIKVRLFRWLLRWTLKYVRMRDDQRYYADYYMAARHDVFNAVGDRLVTRGLVSMTSDVYFLGLEEIDDLWHGRLNTAEARIRIKARREQHEAYRTKTPPFFVRDGLPLVADADESSGNVLKGVAASAGRVKAPARVCRSLEETASIKPGEILVATATDPGWTPVFSIIGGVVVETGGPLAHATLVSREYGIPCITNVNGAMERIRDQQLIELDGNAGLVLLDVAEAD